MCWRSKSPASVRSAAVSSTSRTEPRHAALDPDRKRRNNPAPSRRHNSKNHRREMRVTKKDDPAFLYFPDDYRWSMGLLICISGAPWMGAEIDEVNRVGRALLGHEGDDEAWFAEWKRMGDKVEARGRDAAKAGHKRTAASCFMRASRYYQTGERFKQPRNQESADTYAKSVAIFKEAAAYLHRPRIEAVEVPYEGTSLPALLVHPDPEATGGKPAPCMVFFDGF